MYRNFSRFHQMVRKKSLFRGLFYPNNRVLLIQRNISIFSIYRCTLVLLIIHFNIYWWIYYIRCGTSPKLGEGPGWYSSVSFNLSQSQAHSSDNNAITTYHSLLQLPKFLYDVLISPNMYEFFWVWRGGASWIWR